MLEERRGWPPRLSRWEPVRPANHPADDIAWSTTVRAAYSGLPGQSHRGGDDLEFCLLCIIIMQIVLFGFHSHCGKGA